MKSRHNTLAQSFDVGLINLFNQFPGLVILSAEALAQLDAGQRKLFYASWLHYSNTRPNVIIPISTASKSQTTVTYIQLAIQDKVFAVVKKILPSLKQNDLRVLDHRLFTLQHLAAETGDAAIFDLLTQHDINTLQIKINNPQSRFHHMSPAHIAAMNGNTNILQRIHDQLGDATFTSTTWLQENVSHLAIENNQLETVIFCANNMPKSLIENKNSTGYTPIELSVVHDRINILIYFLGHLDKFTTATSNELILELIHIGCSQPHHSIKCIRYLYGQYNIRFTRKDKEGLSAWDKLITNLMPRSSSRLTKKARNTIQRKLVTFFRSNTNPSDSLQDILNTQINPIVTIL